jgi:(p)ppGpp synthase/HD superfamily hydrolase
MIYSDKISRAIKFSIKTHEVYQKQKRKGKDVAYITHPLTVGIILSHAGAKEDVIIAGILHDTIEDSIETKKVTCDMLIERFGHNVAEIVANVTESDKSLPWDARKKEALEHIETFHHDSLLVKSADIISNATELIDDYKKDGNKIFFRFHAPKGKILNHYILSIEAIIKRWPKNPLIIDLRKIDKQIKTI